MSTQQILMQTHRPVSPAVPTRGSSLVGIKRNDAAVRERASYALAGKHAAIHGLLPEFPTDADAGSAGVWTDRLDRDPVKMHAEENGWLILSELDYYHVAADYWQGKVDNLREKVRQIVDRPPWEDADTSASIVGPVYDRPRASRKRNQEARRKRAAASLANMKVTEVTLRGGRPV